MMNIFVNDGLVSFKELEQKISVLKGKNNSH